MPLASLNPLFIPLETISIRTYLIRKIYIFLVLLNSLGHSTAMEELKLYFDLFRKKVTDNILLTKCDKTDLKFARFSF